MGITDGARAVAGKAVSGGKGIAVGYWRGLTYPFRGLKLVFFEHPKMVRFWIFPIVITVALLSLLGWGGWALQRPIADAVWSRAPSSAEAELEKRAPLYDKAKGKPHKPRMKPNPTGDGWGEAGHVALEWLVMLLVWGVGLFVVIMLTNVIAAPFNDLLSEEVERIVLGIRGPPFSWKVVLRDTIRTAGLEAVKWTIYLVVMVALFLLSFLIPAVGQVLSSIVGFLFTTMYLAIDFIDWPASRRNRSTSYRFGMLTEHFMPMFGFGTGVWLLLFIPLVNLLFMPAAVAGGTLLFLDLEGRESMPAG